MLGQLIFQRFCTFTKIDEAYLLRSRKVFWKKIYYLHALNSPFFKKTKYTRLKFTWMAAGFLVHVMAWLVEPLIICRPLPTLLFTLEVRQVRLKKVSKIRTTL